MGDSDYKVNFSNMILVASSSCPAKYSNLIIIFLHYIILVFRAAMANGLKSVSGSQLNYKILISRE